MGELTDRQYGAHRQVQPGRKKRRVDIGTAEKPIADRQPEKLEEQAVAVVDFDGNPVVESTNTLLTDLLGQLTSELRRTNLLLQMLTEVEVTAADAE